MRPANLRSLEHLDLLSDFEANQLEPLAATLTEIQFPAAATIMRRGERDEWFAIVVDGHAVITRHDDEGERTLGTVGPGSVLGEIALLTRRPRSATVTATTSVTALVGEVDAFATLVDLPGMRARLGRTAAQRLASHAHAVTTTLADGGELEIRPGLPSDREQLVRGIEELSEESRRRRFFSAGPVPRSVIDYLLDVDYWDHFAWVATTRGTGRGVGSARYIRSTDEPLTAELALAVIDEYQGRGVGTLLLGALASAAPAGGIERFRATLLRDNAPIRRLLDKAHAEWAVAEPGVLAATVEVAAVREAIEPGLACELEAVAERVITAAHLALA